MTGEFFDIKVRENCARSLFVSFLPLNQRCCFFLTVNAFLILPICLGDVKVRISVSLKYDFGHTCI